MESIESQESLVNYLIPGAPSTGLDPFPSMERRCPGQAGIDPSGTCSPGSGLTPAEGSHLCDDQNSTPSPGGETLKCLPGLVEGGA